MWLEALDGRPINRRMWVSSRRPTLRVRTGRAAKSISWRLEQHGMVVDEGRLDVRSGDGPVFEIPPSPPSKWLCRSEESPPRYFIPPVDHRKGEYSFRTYSRDPKENLADHSAFAVDINRGGGSTDLGDPVLAAANGVFIPRNANDRYWGKVRVSHWGGKYLTEYSHMDNDAIRKARRRLRRSWRNSQRVTRDNRIIVGVGDVVGAISNTGSSAVHLHHCHFKRKATSSTYEPTQMAFGRSEVEVSHSATDIAAHDPEWVDIIELEGWDPAAPAKFTVSARWKKPGPNGPQSTERSVEFFVRPNPTKKDRRRGNVQKTFSRRGRNRVVVVQHDYDGDTLAPGRYSVRYRYKDDRRKSRWSDWLVDDSVDVTGSSRRSGTRGMGSHEA
jgi:hypothetical protein